MAKITRTDGMQQTSNVGQPIGHTNSGAAISQTVGLAGQELRKEAKLAENVSRGILAEAKRQEAMALETSRNAMYNEHLAKATQEYTSRVGDRSIKRTDEDGNPLYDSLVSDVTNYGQEIKRAYSDKIKDPVVRAKFEKSFSNTANNTQISMLGAARKQRSDHNTAAFNTMMDNKVEEAQRGDFDSIDSHLGEAEDLIASQVASGDMTQEQAVAAMSNVDRQVRVHHYKEIIDTYPQHALALIEAGNTGLTAPDEAILRNKAERASQQSMQRQKAIASSLEQKQAHIYEQADKHLAKGNAVPDNLLSHLIETTAGTPLEAKTNNLLAKADVTSRFVGMSVAERKEQLSSLQDAGYLDKNSVAVVESLTKLDEELDKQLKNDAVQYGIDRGIVEERAAFDVNGDIGVQLSELQDTRDLIKSEYGQDSTGLTKVELDSLVQHIDSQDNDGKLVTMSQVVSGLGHEASADFFGEMRIKGQSNMAYAGMLLAEGRDDIARGIMSGMELAKDKSLKIVSDKKFSEAISQEMPNYYRTDQRLDVLKATRAMYNHLAFTNGNIDSEGDVDDSTLRQALEAVTNGEAIEWNGTKLEAPERGVTESDFEDWIDSFDNAKLRAAGAVIDDRDNARDMFSDATIKSVGRGSYIVIRNDGSGDGYLKAKDGSVFILEYSATPQAEEEENQAWSNMRGSMPTIL